MIRFFSLIQVFVGLFSLSLNGQPSCFNGKVLWIYTQTELDSLMQTATGCKVFGGNLILQYDDRDPITNLNALKDIESFPEQLSINYQQALYDLTGLENVKSIGSFWFHENTSLRSFKGLENLEEISGRFVIKRHDNIVDLTGFESLRIAGNQVDISFNDNLLSLSGLDQLEMVATRIYIGNNPRLENINGLNSLKQVGRQIFIVSNESINTISGLQELQSAETLIINGNESLQSIKGFSILENIENVRISNNDLLTDISGLAGIGVVNIRNFDVWNNKSLAICNIIPLCELVKKSNEVQYIDNNAIGCMSSEEVEIQCTVKTTEVQVDNRHKVYPNPSSGHTTLEFGSPRSGTIRIQDISGSTVQNRSFADKEIVSLTFDVPGVYLIQIVFDDGTAETHKHIVTK